MEEEAEQFWKNQDLFDQSKLKKPTMAQLLSQRFSCEILFNLLSSGEKCIYHNHKDRKYRYYDPLMSAKSKGQDDLELEFRDQVTCFQACFIDDVEKGGFRYPDNLKKQDIIEDVKKWMKYAKMGNRDILYKTYEKFILLLEEEKKIIVDKIKNNKIYEMNEKYKGIFENNKDIKYFIFSGLKCKKDAFEFEEIVKIDYKRGDYAINAMLFKDPQKEKTIIRKIGEKIGLFV